MVRANVMSEEEVHDLLDFKFQREHLVHRMSYDEEDVLDTDLDIITRDDKDKREFLGVVGRDYTLVPHAEAYDLFRQTAIGQLGKAETIRVKWPGPRFGARMYTDIIFPETKIDIGGKNHGDVVDLHLTLVNSYDRSTSLKIEVGGYRLVCSNGLRVGKSIFEMREIHGKGLDISVMANSLKNKLHKEVSHMSYFFTRMASLEINESLANSIRDRLIGAGLPKEHAVIGQARWNTPVRELDKPRTLWTLYNAYTEFFTRTDTPRMDELNTLTTDVFMKLAA